MSRRAGNHWLALVVVCFAQFMVVLDATVVNVALPSIQRDLELSESNLQWVVNAYTLVFGGFLLLGGRAADLLGRRLLFLAGVGIFTGASLLNALAGSGEMLILARGLQGLGGALLSPAALSIITTTFAEGRERTRALGVWGGIAAGGGAFGLLLGGVLTDALSWEWIFLVNVPIGALVAVATVRLVPESKAAAAHRSFDVAGAVSVTAGLVLLVYTIVKAQEWGWGSLTTLLYGAGTLALLAAFLVIERRSAEPLVRLGIFRTRSLSAANGTMLVVAGGMFAMFFFASLYVQLILGFSPLKTGLGFLPISAGIMIGAALSQQLIKRLGVKSVNVIGMSIAAAGLLVLAMTTRVDGSYSSILAGLLPMSIGMGLTFVPLTLIATTNVAADDAGLASGAFNTSQQVGGALGLAILSTIATERTAGVLSGGAGQAAALVEGYRTAFAVSAALMLVGIALILLLVRRRDVALIDTTEPVLVGA